MDEIMNETQVCSKLLHGGAKKIDHCQLISWIVVWRRKSKVVWL